MLWLRRSDRRLHLVGYNNGNGNGTFTAAAATAIDVECFQTQGVKLRYPPRFIELIASLP